MADYFPSLPKQREFKLEIPGFVKDIADLKDREAARNIAQQREKRLSKKQRLEMLDNIIEIGKNWIGTVQNKDQYNQTRPLMLQKYGLDPNLIPEYTGTDQEFEQFKAEMILGADAYKNIAKGEKFPIYKLQEDGPTVGMDVTQKQFDSLKEEGLVGNDWKLGKPTDANWKSLDRFKQEEKIKAEQKAVSPGKTPTLKTGKNPDTNQNEYFYLDKDNNPVWIGVESDKLDPAKKAAIQMITGDMVTNLKFQKLSLEERKAIVEETAKLFEEETEKIEIEGKQYEILSREEDGTIRIKDPETGRTGTYRE